MNQSRMKESVSAIPQVEGIVELTGPESPPHTASSQPTQFAHPNARNSQ